MKMKTFFIFSVFTMIMLQSAAADGGFFIELIEQGEASRPITEHAQRAFLYYDESNGLERLVVEAKTEWIRGSFAWFIPIPYVPSDFSQYIYDHVDEVLGGGTEFDRLNDFSAPVLTLKTYRREYSGGMSYTVFSCFVSSASMDADGRVSDSETEETGIDDILWSEKVTENLSFYLVSGTVDQISGWFPDHSFGFLPDEYRDVFGHYEREDGFSILLITGRENTGSAFHSGVSVTFPAEEAFFPMKVSGPGSGETLDLLLYICSDIPIEPAGEVRDYRAEMFFNAGEVFLLDRDTPWMDEWEVQNRITFGRPYWSGDAMHDEAFMAVCDGILAEIGLSTDGSLPSDTFWRQRRVHLTGNDCPFIADLAAPGNELTLSRFRKSYYGRLSEHYPPDGPDDIAFVRAQPDEFMGEIRIHALIDDGYSRAAHSDPPDIGFIIPFLFPLWLKGCQFMKRRRQKRRF
ncbi:MAG: hypothetical protein JW881_03605 [Spirochaetales bacterium]|nr:hypothetical protein [Spirochaetales bacterium]